MGYEKEVLKELMKVFHIVVTLGFIGVVYTMLLRLEKVEEAQSVMIQTSIVQNEILRECAAELFPEEEVVEVVVISADDVMLHHVTILPNADPITEEEIQNDK